MPAHVLSYALATGVAVTAVGLMTKKIFGKQVLLTAFSASAHHCRWATQVAHLAYRTRHALSAIIEHLNGEYDGLLNPVVMARY